MVGAFCIFLALNALQFPHSIYKHNVGNCKSFRIRNLTKIASPKSGTSARNARYRVNQAVKVIPIRALRFG